MRAAWMHSGYVHSANDHHQAEQIRLVRASSAREDHVKSLHKVDQDVLAIRCDPVGEHDLRPATIRSAPPPGSNRSSGESDTSFENATSHVPQLDPGGGDPLHRPQDSGPCMRLVGRQPLPTMRHRRIAMFHSSEKISMMRCMIRR